MATLAALGGGPTNDVPAAYLVALGRLLDGLRGEQWQSWSSSSPLQKIEVCYTFETRRVGVKSRQRGSLLKVDLQRPVETIVGPDLVELAWLDAQSVVDTVRTKARLGAAPALPAFPDLSRLIERDLRVADESNKRVEALLARLADRLPRAAMRDLLDPQMALTWQDLVLELAFEVKHAEVALSSDEQQELGDLHDAIRRAEDQNEVWVSRNA